MNPHYTRVALRARHRCEYCHAPEVIFNFPFEVEHIIPVSRGGISAESNLALACRSCNIRKAAHVSGIDPESQSVIRLFNPREDLWDEHFEANTENGDIVGKTPIGKVTAALLRMNGNAQIIARHQWIRLGLFP